MKHAWKPRINNYYVSEYSFMNERAGLSCQPLSRAFCFIYKTSMPASLRTTSPALIKTIQTMKKGY